MNDANEGRNRLLNGWQLSKMYTFEVAARHESFALAAEELSLSPSAVSHRINLLEEELGIALFVRSHRKVELTQEGKRVYWTLKSSLDTLNQEILDIKNQALSGTLTFTLVRRLPSAGWCHARGFHPALSAISLIHPDRQETSICSERYRSGALFRRYAASQFDASLPDGRGDFTRLLAGVCPGT